MSYRYELVVIFNPDLDDAGIQAQLEKIAGIVSQHSGSVVRQDLWGRKQLAYRIQKRDSGFFVVTVIEGDSSLVADLDRQLRINESVLRHMIVDKDKYAPDVSTRLLKEEEPPIGDLVGDDAEADEAQV